MKCFEGENTTHCGRPNPVHPLLWLQRVGPWSRPLTGDRRLTRTQSTPRHPSRKMGEQSVKGSGMPRCGPLGYSVGSGRGGGVRSSDAPAGSCWLPPPPPHSPRLVTQASRRSGPVGENGGIWVSGLGAWGSREPWA